MKKGKIEKLLNKCGFFLKLHKRGEWCKALSPKDRKHKKPGDTYDVMYRGGRFGFAGGWSREEAAAQCLESYTHAYIVTLIRFNHVGIRYLIEKGDKWAIAVQKKVD